jgi:hypothetical protein
MAVTRRSNGSTGIAGRLVTERMLARLKRASRRCIALVWAMMLVFALAPVVSVAYGAPAGVISGFVLHSHEGGDADHIHHGHHHHHHHGHHHDLDGHDHDGHHHDDDATDDGPQDGGQGPLHVHYDASCPTVLTSVPTAEALYRLAERITLPHVEAKQGAPPGRLLRPPILTF